MRKHYQLITTIALVYMILPFLAFSQAKGSINKSTYHILKPGIGLDQVIVGQTTEKDILYLYGNDFIRDTFFSYSYADNLDTVIPPHKFIYNHRMRYPKLGVSFYFYPESYSIFGVLVASPFKAMTVDSVIPNVTSFREIIKKYGECEWGMAGYYKMLDYDTIIFSNNFKDTFPVSIERQTEYLDELVEEIFIKTTNMSINNYRRKSDEILKRFKNLEDSFRIHAGILDSIPEKQFSSQNTPRITALKTHTKLVCDNIKNIKDSINDLMRMGPNDDNALNGHFKSKPFSQLRTLLINHQQFLKDSFTKEYPTINDLFPNLANGKKNDKKTSWEYIYFKHSPAVAIITYLTYLENQMRQIQLTLMKDLY